LKRSNRLVLLVGVFLAIVAFIGILLLSQPGDGGTTPDGPPTEQAVVVASADIPLGAAVQPGDVTTQTVPIAGVLPGSFTEPSQVIGRIVRQPVTTGQQLTGDTFGAREGQLTEITCPPGLVCIAVQVDQTTGVGTLIKSGDYVDMVAGFTGDKFPVITLNEQDDTFTVVAGINSTSVKALLQGMQVVGSMKSWGDRRVRLSEPSIWANLMTSACWVVTARMTICC
jgi:Flp pilus assembly protein CpaB